jgi:putative cardiolipin synthase
LPVMQAQLMRMPVYFDSDFHDADVRLAHEFGNLVNKRVVTEAMENLEKNPNSIMHVLRQSDDMGIKQARLVSPYLFLARYEDKDGNVIHDEAANILMWLDQDPDYTVEIITNSVLTSDNVGAQAVIDMDTAPRLLLTEDMQAAWLEKSKLSELNSVLMSSDEWQQMVSHPRLKVYETGRLDDVLLGGDKDYGKLHAKFIVLDDIGFVGTANFDYRSRLFNNEMGFFFDSAGLAQDINDDFESLIENSLLWGSPEWLQMRQETGELSGTKGYSVRNQRSMYKFLRSTGLLWLF